MKLFWCPNVKRRVWAPKRISFELRATANFASCLNTQCFCYFLIKLGSRASGITIIPKPFLVVSVYVTSRRLKVCCWELRVLPHFKSQLPSEKLTSSRTKWRDKGYHFKPEKSIYGRVYHFSFCLFVAMHLIIIDLII